MFVSFLLLDGQCDSTFAGILRIFGFVINLLGNLLRLLICIGQPCEEGNAFITASITTIVILRVQCRSRLPLREGNAS